MTRLLAPNSRRSSRAFSRLRALARHAAQGNHPRLERDLKLLLDECRRSDARAVARDYTETIDKARRRIGTRSCWVTTDLSRLPAGEAWEDLGSFACLESTRQMGEKVESNQRYYTSSIEKRDATRMLEHVRGHRGFEDRRHWRFDVVFD